MSPVSNENLNSGTAGAYRKRKRSPNKAAKKMSQLRYIQKQAGIEGGEDSVVPRDDQVSIQRSLGDQDSEELLLEQGDSIGDLLYSN